MKNNSTRRNLLLACALGLVSSLSVAAWPDTAVKTPSRWPVRPFAAWRWGWA